MSATTITVHTAADVMTTATIPYLDRAGLGYRAEPADELSVSVVGPDGDVSTWRGFRPDLLRGLT